MHLLIGVTLVSGNPSPVLGDVDYSLTGKGVDIIIQDSGVLRNHPEFRDYNGVSRVRDVILDGPYYLDKHCIGMQIPVSYILRTEE